MLRAALAGAVSLATMGAGPPASAQEPFQEPLADARAAFYSARYEQAGTLTLDLCATGDMEACELRSSALLFEMRRAIGGTKDQDKAFKACDTCPAILEAFLRDTARGQAAARAGLKANAGDDTAQYLLGKLDLNYVWMQVGTIGRRTGWGEYWEARRALDAVLKRNPRHVRAKVARAWIDYIVDTRMPRGTRWLMGGGNKKKALAAMREASTAETDFYTNAEARFGLWDMLVREKRFPEAVVLAHELAKDFPDNTDLPRFLEAHDPH